MLMGSGDPTPLDGWALSLLCGLAVLLLVGCVLGPRWASAVASWLRWGALLAAAFVLAAVVLLTPSTTAIVSAGRWLSIYPAAAGVLLLFLGWSWRVGGLWWGRLP